MSVFTRVDRLQLEAFLQNYDLGPLRSFEGVPSGIENTNYFVDTERGRYVLTLFEKLSAAELPFFMELTAFLAERQVPCPHPIPDRAGRYLGELKQKPAALVQRLRGASIERPTVAQCAAVGRVLAQLHLAGAEFARRRENDHGISWRSRTAEALAPRLSAETNQFIREELRLDAARQTDLPQGVVHADLFRDNVLFEGEQLCGVIDFYYACTDILLLDIAITVNDWCSNTDGELEESPARALLNAYHALRPLTAAERAAWPLMLRTAALRFWLSRLYDLHFPRPGAITHSKDPAVFSNILRRRIEHTAALQQVWPTKETAAQRKKA